MRTAEDAEPRQGKRLYGEEQSPLLNRPLRNRLEMTSSDAVQIPQCPPQGDHWRETSAGESFGLPEGDTTSASSEATVLAFQPHDPSGPGQSLTVRMIFRCSFCNRGFDRKSYRDEYEKSHDSNLIFMERSDSTELSLWPFTWKENSDENDVLIALGENSGKNEVLN
jgi:hypothetical protein